MAQNQGNLPKPRQAQGNRGNNGARNSAEEMTAKLAQLRSEMNKKIWRDYVRGFLPPHVRHDDFYVDRLISSVLSACRANTKLLTHTSMVSLLTAAEEVAKRGLYVGENVAWIVPYYEKGQSLMTAQFQLGYRGCITLAHASGIPMVIRTGAVFEADYFDHDIGMEPYLHHKKRLKIDSQGDLIASYAMIKFTAEGYGGEVDMEIMPYSDIKKIREGSPGRNSPAWSNWEPEMARKLPLKRLLKRQPFQNHDQFRDMDDGHIIEGKAEEVRETDMPGTGPALTDQRGDDQPINIIDPDQQQTKEREPAAKDAKAAKGNKREQQANDPGPTDHEDMAGDGWEDDEGGAGRIQTTGKGEDQDDFPFDD